ncbi:MAG: ATP-dependent Clp protease adaptor ClpS [Caldilineaceae bacterium]|nr:ATP-dependent Clp protease adaptor ClpS [Caldilineaceae bacterium]
MSESAMQPVPETNVEEASKGTIGVYSTEGMATILVYNDEVTPYDYVMNMLSDLFMLSEEMADHIAWTAHTKGVAVVVVRPHAEAVKLVKVARGRARFVGYPLRFSLGQG